MDEKSPGYTCCLEQPIPDTDTLTTVYFPCRSMLLLQKHNLSELVLCLQFLRITAQHKPESASCGMSGLLQSYLGVAYAGHEQALHLIGLVSS